MRLSSHLDAQRAAGWHTVLEHQAQHHWGAARPRGDWTVRWSGSELMRSWGSEKPAIAALAAILTVLCFAVLPGWAPSARAERAPVQSLAEIALPLPPARLTQALPAEADDWQSLVVERGETMGDLFARLGIDAPGSTLHRVLEGVSTPQALTRIRPGQHFWFRVEAGALTALRYERDESTRVEVMISADAVRESRSFAVAERRIRSASAVITGSLFGAGERAGISDAALMQLADVFGYDIDFAQDLRVGDRFDVIYEQIYRDGEWLRDGSILAASFVNQGRRYVALRHLDDDGRIDYFGPDGRSLRRAFLRTPVEFSRISSRFSAARRHPILGRMRAHRGVDYAAPSGTPVRAAGSGRVAFRGQQNGYGNVIVLEHGSRHSTLYAHLSRFGKGVARGAKVQQGEVIGYVGATGLATAPHLHYEFRLDGAHRDPLTVALPKAEPLRGTALAQFRSATEPLTARLGLMQEQALLAANR